MKKIIVLAAFGFMAYNASATTVCGALSLEIVECFAAPCPPIVRLSPSSGKPYAVVAVKGSAAETFLNNLTPGTRTACIDGQIVRETTLKAVAIRLAKQ